MGVGAAEKPLIKRRFRKMANVIIFLVRKCMVKRRCSHEEFTKTGKLLANNWRNMMLQSGSNGPFGLREYEFSCSNSPAFTNKLTRPRQVRNFFSCARTTTFEAEEEYNMRVDILQPCNFPAVEEGASQTYDLGDGEELGTPVSRSINVRVDREAEDFIARFHSQIKFQRQISLLEYEEMLARGA
ncbi:hypothetical protein SUGI_0773450 [Cryptomeria japonica]|uniref:uncharacterized protein LOC131857066 n=1 Tax=Cryptomeria japonica TaxID=3369 RepID=UPI002414A6DB|nr:uncharacterized protein LOC131857066 [Cryptomeria japonica]GLJ38002.1 hypothetical protein SUGI_0773450 [Cryptomeria japonica]